MPEHQSFVSPAFDRDMCDTAAWTREYFGITASGRYAKLVRQVMRDVKADPLRLGTKARFDLAPFTYTYHLFHSRDRVLGDKVRAPRHFIVFRFTGEQIEFARLLHDSRDRIRHLPESSS